MKKFMKQFHYGEKGFTLIELLVVIAILGVLAAIAVPNVGKFMGKGKTQAADTEKHNVQTAVMAAMADASSGNVTGDGSGGPFAFGNTGNTVPPSVAVDCLVYSIGGVDYNVGDYIMGGVEKVQGEYTIASDGSVVEQVFYPGVTP